MRRNPLIACLMLLSACSEMGRTNSDGAMDAQSTQDVVPLDACICDVRTDDADRMGDGSVLSDPTAFRRGVNPGYYGSGIDRRESAQLSKRAGANSLRSTLPERYLTQWGDGIETGDYAYYASMGLEHHAVFLIGPTAAHSSAPAGTPDWELDHYAPKNLYEPIFLADGSVNPNNYWAAYCDRVARTYGDRIDIYEVWNEPDQVGGNWQVTQQWSTRAPLASEMIWWHDSFFAYVRALRIASTVIHRADPTGKVTVGGIGYPSFLSALSRYSDEPTMGRVTTEYPSTGVQYLDVVSYHYYPVFGTGPSDRGVDGFFELRDQLRTVMQSAGLGQIKYVVTESGAPRYAFGTMPGGADYASNYLLKLMTLAHAEGFVGVDWFAQGDGEAMGASMDPFKYMGLFFDYSMATLPDAVQISPQGQAYAWLASWIDGTANDATSWSTLQAPATVRGAAFSKTSGGKLYVLWAKTSTQEATSVSFAFPTTSPIQVRTWSLSGGERLETRTPAQGAVILSLTSTPIVVEVP